MTTNKILVALVFVVVLLFAAGQCNAVHDGRLAEQLDRLETNGAKVALVARDSRIGALEADSAFRKRLASHNRRVLTPVLTTPEPRLVAIDSAAGRVIVGQPIPPLDTLVTLGQLRQLSRDLVDSATARIAVLELHITEDHRTLDQAVAVVDTLKVSLSHQTRYSAIQDSVIVALKAQKPSFWRRAGSTLRAAGVGAIITLAWVTVKP